MTLQSPHPSYNVLSAKLYLLSIYICTLMTILKFLIEPIQFSLRFINHSPLICCSYKRLVFLYFSIEIIDIGVLVIFNLSKGFDFLFSIFESWNNLGVLYGMRFEEVFSLYLFIDYKCREMAFHPHHIGDTTADSSAFPHLPETGKHIT